MIQKITVDYGGSWTRIDGVNRLGKNLLALKIKSKPLSILPLTLKSVFKRWNLERLPLLVIGAKSVWTALEKTRLLKRVQTLAEKVQVMSDIELAHRKIFGGKPGILVLAGTGSIAFGRNKKGKTARAGGWGPKRGDEGSGYWIGKVYGERVLKSRKKKSVQDLAALAPRVIRQAQAGNPASKEITAEAQAHLARLAASVRRQLKEKSLKVRLAGGMFESAYFRSGFLNLLRSADAAL